MAAIEDLRTKYRPRKFSEIVGQDEFVEKFRDIAKAGAPNENAILLEGTRGTGKTTSARILAAALNCKHVDEDGEPCGECAECESALSGKGGLMVAQEVNCSGFNVQQAREFNASLKMNTTAKWRVIIYDEAQELKATAPEFLKPVEEPEPGVFYIFCTTHAHRLPEALLTRMTRYSLHDVSHDALAQHITEIAEEEEIDISAEDVSLIVGGAEGSVRMAISRLMALRDGLPLTDPRVATAVADALVAGDLGRALVAIKRAEGLGTLDARLVSDDLQTFYGDVLSCRFEPSLLDIIARRRSEEYVALVEEAAADADNISHSEIVRGVSIMAHAIGAMSSGNSTVAQLEAAVVKILHPEEEMIARKFVDLLRDTLDESDGQLVLNVTNNVTGTSAIAAAPAEAESDDIWGGETPFKDGAWDALDDQPVDDEDDAHVEDNASDEDEDIEEVEVAEEEPAPKKPARKKRTAVKKRAPKPEPEEEDESDSEDEIEEIEEEVDSDDVDEFDDADEEDVADEDYEDEEMEGEPEEEDHDEEDDEDDEDYEEESDDLDEDEDDEDYADEEVDVEEVIEDDEDDEDEEESDDDLDEDEEDEELVDDQEDSDDEDDAENDEMSAEQYDEKVLELMLATASKRKSSRVRDILDAASFIGFEVDDNDTEFLVVELVDVRSDKMLDLIERIAASALDEMQLDETELDVFSVDGDED